MKTVSILAALGLVTFLLFAFTTSAKPEPAGPPPAPEAPQPKPDPTLLLLAPRDPEPKPVQTPEVEFRPDRDGVVEARLDLLRQQLQPTLKQGERIEEYTMFSRSGPRRHLKVVKALATPGID